MSLGHKQDAVIITQWECLAMRFRPRGQRAERTHTHTHTLAVCGRGSGNRLHFESFSVRLIAVITSVWCSGRWRKFSPNLSKMCLFFRSVPLTQAQTQRQGCLDDTDEEDVFVKCVCVAQICCRLLIMLLFVMERNPSLTFWKTISG